MELWPFQGNRVVGEIFGFIWLENVGMVGMVGHEFWLAQDFFISNSSSLVEFFCLLVPLVYHS